MLWLHLIWTCKIWTWTTTALTHSHVIQGQFCTHVLQQHKEKEDSARRSKEVAFTLPATTRALGHGIPVVCIDSTYDGTPITVQEDGAVCFWSPELKPQRTKHIFVCKFTLILWCHCIFFSCQDNLFEHPNQGVSQYRNNVISCKDPKRWGI